MTADPDPSITVITSPHGERYGDSQGSSSTSRNISSNRIVSGASTLEEETSSTGGEKILFSKEVTTGTFCSNLFAHLLQSVWPDGQVVMDWVKGRGETTLTWADT